MSDKKELTFEEFAKMCEDAGISASPADMETDFRVGGVIADVVDQLMTDIEAHPKLADPGVGYTGLENVMDNLAVSITNKDAEAVRRDVVGLAAMAVRFAADLCHDEGRN